MIISQGRQYIFVHIPKTGGTSMALALEQRAMRDDILIGDTPKAKKRRRRVDGVVTKGRVWKHSTLADVDGLIDLGTIRDCFCFTMVRNPWDRMVSYYHWLRHQSFEHPAVRLAKAEAFSQFLNSALIQTSLRAGQYRYYMIAADGQEYAQLYLRLERLEEDAEILWHHLGFQLELPHLNTSERKKDYRPYFSDKDAETIATLCRQDIERFGYSF